MKLPSIRMTYLLGFIGISILLSITTYLQLYDGITPCPLCIFQRIGLVAVGIVFFIAALLKFGKVIRCILATLSCLFSLFGIVFAGRQVWLQHLPPTDGGGCGASIEYMLHILPIQEVIKKVFIGGTECSQVTWEFLRLSLAEWSLLCFVFILGVSVFQFYRIIKR
jgi:disulfide bond formation protein DsbB